jgi:predicted nucleotidyltransferase
MNPNKCPGMDESPILGYDFQRFRVTRASGGIAMGDEIMDIDAVIGFLKAVKPKFEKDYGLRRLGLFGSVARGGKETSRDVDVVVDLDRQDLFVLIGIKQELEESLHTKVDVVSYRKNMNPFLKRRIDAEAIYV